MIYKQRRKVLLLLICSIGCLLMLFPLTHAHENASVHPYITNQAFYVWPNDIYHEISRFLPTGMSYLTDWGDAPYGTCPDYVKTGQCIIEGAKEEDDYDPLMKTCFLSGGDASTYNHHFWNCDEPGNNTGLFADINAYYYASTVYWPLIRSYYLQYCNESNDEAGRLAYYYLGRLAHLLADMSVPAHVHNDPHPLSDAYENYVESNFGNWSFSDARSLENSTDTSLLNKSGLTLEQLFWNLAQRSQYFPSDNVYGNSDHSTGSENNIPGLTWFQGWPTDTNQMLNSSPFEISPENCNIIGDYLMPLAIQYTAALYKYFWRSLHPAPTLTSLTNTGPGKVLVKWNPPVDGVDIASYTIKYGHSSGNKTTTVNNISSSLSQYEVTGLTGYDCQDTRYYFAVVAVDARGNASIDSNEIQVDITPGYVHALFSIDDSTVLPGDTVHFDASASYDEIGSITDYSWDFGDGVTISGSNKKKVSHIFTQERYYDVKLTVTGSSGDTACLIKGVYVGSGGILYMNGKTFNSDYTFSNYYHTYVINGSINISDGATVTIEPNVTIKISGSINVYGELRASNVIFTWKDEYYPWTGIIFSGYGASGSYLENCVIEHVKSGYRAVAISCASPRISGCTIKNSPGATGISIFGDSTSVITGNTITGLATGIYVSREQCGSSYFSPAPTVTNNTITDNQYGISVSSNNTGTYTNNTINGNTTYGFYYTGSTVLNATYCDWGDFSGPYDPSDDRATGGLYNPDGKGDKVSDHVNYDPWVTKDQPIPGDVNHDGFIDLTDAVLVLQILTGQTPAETVYADADVNEDGRLGMEEVVYILQLVAG